MTSVLTFPVNYEYNKKTYIVESGSRREITQISDNDYATSIEGNRFIFETHGDSLTDNNILNRIFIKGGSITNYSISIPTGKGSGTSEITNRTIPAAGVIGGIQHDFANMGTLTATEIQLDLVGTDAYLIEVMIMRTLLDLDPNFTVINPFKLDRDARVITNINGNSFKIPGRSRPKWSTDLQMVFAPGILHNGAELTGEAMGRIFDSNPNFAFEQDETVWPDRVYPATISGGVATTYLGRLYTQQHLDFTILEM